MTLTKDDLQAIGELIDNKLDTKFEQQDRRIEERFEQQDAILNSSFEQVHERFDAVEERLNVLESDMREVKSDVSGLQRNVGELQRNVTTLQCDMREVKGTTAEILNKMDLTEHDFQEVYDYRAVDTERIDNHEARIRKLEETAAGA